MQYDLIPLQFVKGDFRFDIAYALYMGSFFEEFNFLFLTDVADVLFQTDLRQYNYSEGVYISEEATISLKRSHYWISTFKHLPKFEDGMTDLCVGTLLFVGQKSFSFLKDMHDFLNNHQNLVVKRPNFQGTMQYLLYDKTYQSQTQLRFYYITTRYGIFNSLGKYLEHSYFLQQKYPFMPKFDVYDIHIHDQYFYLYTLDFQKQSVLHHINRFPNIFTKTYNGILYQCKKDKQETFEQLMYIKSTTADKHKDNRILLK